MPVRLEITTQAGSVHSECVGSNRLVMENVDLLRQGIDVVSSLPDGCYERNAHTLFADGIGRHFRHILDFYERLLDRAGLVDYDARRRDPRVESDRGHAIREAERMIGKLIRLASGSGTVDSQPVVVRVEVKSESGTGLITASSMARELAMLASHTTHHYAIIGLLMKIQGVVPPEDFGIAPSTLRHRAATASRAELSDSAST